MGSVLDKDLSRCRDIFVSHSRISGHPTEIATAKSDLSGDTLTVHAGHDDHECGHGADHDGVDAGAEQRDHSLRHGLFRLRGGMRDGR